jgi:hypothetical protein
MSDLGAPVYAVSVAPTIPRRDVSVAPLVAPASVRLGETFTVRVDFRAVGYLGQTFEVRLDVRDYPQVQSVTVGADSQGSATFEVLARRAGPTPITATVVPGASEMSDENNRAERIIKVAADPLRATVLYGADAGRQRGSLHDALARMAWVAVRELEEDEAYRLSPAAILAQDVVVLCDLPPDGLAAEQWAALDRLVRRRGGTVVLIAGAHLPVAYRSYPDSEDWLPHDATEWPTWRTWPGGEPHFRFAPAAGDAAAAAQWPRLPAVSRFAPVLRLAPAARPILVERETGAALMTETPRGAGKVLYLGTDEAWRWRGDPGRIEGFWPQLLRRTGAEPYAAAEPNLWLDASNLSPEPDQALRLRARVLGSDGSPSDAPSQVVHVTGDDDDGEEVATAVLQLAGGGDGRYEGILEGLPAGDYVLRLDPPPDPSAEIPPDPVTLPLRVAPDMQPELADLTGDERLLRRLAESSGGQLVTLDQLPLLPRLLAENRQRLTTVVEYPLWDSPWLFGFVLACLSTEWALRKKFGLA